MAARKRPCDFCEGDIIKNEEGKNGHWLALEWYPDNGFLSIGSFAFDDCGETDEIEWALECNYCPKCGRKLDF